MKISPLGDFSGTKTLSENFDFSCWPQMVRNMMKGTLLKEFGGKTFLEENNFSLRVFSASRGQECVGLLFKY